MKPPVTLIRKCRECGFDHMSDQPHKGFREEMNRLERQAEEDAAELGRLKALNRERQRRYQSKKRAAKNV